MELPYARKTDDRLSPQRNAENYSGLAAVRNAKMNSAAESTAAIDDKQHTREGRQNKQKPASQKSVSVTDDKLVSPRNHAARLQQSPR